MACTDKSLYADMPWCPGSPVLPGIRGKVLCISKKDIVSWPTLKDRKTATSMADLVTYTGNFTLASDKKWLIIDIVDNKSSVTSEAQGEQPCITNLNKGTFMYPGTNEDATGFAAQANSDDLVYIFFSKEGKARVLGNEMWQTTTKVSQNTGSGPTDEAGTTIEVEVTDLCPAPFYPGELETSEGTYDGATGTLAGE